MSDTMTDKHAASWGDFWADNKKSGSGGCLPSGWQGIDGAQQRVWHGFAEGLPRGAKMLDLATGDGRVMGWMLKARRDLKPVGTDLAPDLPSPPKGTKVKAGVPMEKLPFGDHSFAAVVSQFGFEYGDVALTAAEIARVLRPDGKVGLLMHRGDGPILAHNLARREQIRWALEERDLVSVGKNSLKARALGITAIPDAIIQAPQQGAQQFGPQSAAWEIAEAVRQCLALGRRDHPANAARLLDSIALKAKNELGRIASLEAACAQADDEAGLDAAFDAAGLETVAANIIGEGSGKPPFATFRQLRLKR